MVKPYLDVPEEEEKISFVTNLGTHYYRLMPYDLKNIGATYQRLVNLKFRPLIGKSMEVYVDDHLVKTMQAVDHLKHLDESFNILQNF